MKQINIVSHTSQPSESVQRLLNKLPPLSDVIEFHYGNGKNKLKQYEFFRQHGLPHPQFTTNHEEAVQWKLHGDTVVCRTLINGQEGHGILVVEPSVTELPEAKIYTRYIKKKREFRVNILKDKLVNVREKVKKTGATNVNPKIRSLSNGYTFAKCTDYPSKLVELALKARKVSESDFIGVDIGYNEYKNFLFILEVNSGPAIEGASVNDFVEIMKHYAASN